MSSELTETELITKINSIDTDIATITSELGGGGVGAVGNLKYEMGSKSVDGTGRLKQLMEARNLYQGMLNQIPKLFIRNHDFVVDHGTGASRTEEIGDQ